MITLTAKINLLSGDNNALSFKESNLLGNNISSDLGSVTGRKIEDSTNPFLFGVSKFGDTSTFKEKVDYFIAKGLSDDMGNFLPAKSITVSSNTPLTNITIEFDTENNRHPNFIVVNDVKYIDDDAIFTIPKLSPTKKITFGINDWNEPNKPLIIKGIYTEIVINIDHRNLMSIESSIYDRSDFKLPSFGIISNTGNIEFVDLDGEIRDYAEQLLLEKGLKCEIKLNNTLVEGASETVSVMETNEWDYDNDNRIVSVSLKDDLEEWQEINVDLINYDPRKREHKPFKWLYEHLWEITAQNYTMLSFDDLDDETKNVLQTVYVEYPFLNAGTLWQQWTKLCEVCHLHIYKNNDGVVVCRYNGGN